MRLPLMTALLLVFLSSCLTACVHDTPKPQVITKIQIERPKLPANKLYCRTRPEPPAKPESGRTMSKAAAWYFALLEAWGEDCEAKLAEVRDVLQPALAPMTPVQ